MTLTPSDIVLRDTICETREELNEWLKYFLDIYLPDCIVDKEHSNCCPLDMVWSVYNSALRTQEIKNALYIGNRGGGKTLGAAVLEFLLLQHDYRSVTHIGAIEKQADRCYNYFQQFYRKEAFKEFVDKMVMKQTVVKGRGTFEILPCTLASVNGPHTPLVVRDEIDTVQDQQAYSDIKGIAAQMPDKRPAIEIGISTRKTAFGLVQQEVDQSRITGMKVFKWGILETTERCSDERSGLRKIPLYVQPDNLITLTEDEWKILSDKERREYTFYEGYEGCVKNCKMFAACRAFLKNQTCQSPYLNTVGWTQEKVLSSSPDWTNAQHLSIKPSPTGLVYSNFREERSVKSYKEMLEIWVGEEIKTDREVTLEDFVKVVEGIGGYAVMGQDFGFTNPSVSLLIYIDKVDNIYVVKEFAVTGMDGAELAYYLGKNWLPNYNIEMVYADIEDPGNIKLLRKEGFVCAVAQKDAERGAGRQRILDKDIKGGIETVRKFIRVPGTNKTKLFIHPSCTLLLQEIKKYHYKTDRFGKVTDDTPEKEWDHSLDSLRYPLHSRYGNREVEIVLDGGQREIFMPDLTKAPSAGEMALRLGLPFNDNEEFYNQMKEKEKTKEIKTHLGIKLKDPDIEEGDDDEREDNFSFTF